MKRLFLIFTLPIIFAASIFGAYFENVPHTLVQPNGEVLEVFITGDEFFNKIHDKDGYTIVQRADGWYCYALYDDENDRLIASEYEVSKHRGVLPMEKGVGISYENYQKRRKAFGWDDNTLETTLLQRLSESKGNNEPMKITNIVICIGFAETQVMNYTYQQVNALVNTSANYNLRDYFSTMSYGKVDVESYLTPPAPESPTELRFYKDPLPWEWYRDNTPQDDVITALTNFQPLLRRAVDWVNEYHPIPQDIVLDADGDGFVDFVTFIIFGPTVSSTLLWPHQSWFNQSWDIYQEIKINGKDLRAYNCLPDGDAQYFGVGVMAHEGFHVLGSPDLYHGGNDVFQYLLGGQPVRTFDVMSHTSYDKPQSMAAYMKWKYGKWIQNVPVAQWNKTYEVYPNYFHDGSDPDKPVLINVPSSDEYQYYSIEYRKKTGAKYDDQPAISTEGLLIYRINPRFNGNLAYYFANERYDEIYLYRPGSQPTTFMIFTFYSEGTLATANFGGSRNTFNNTTDPRSWLCDFTNDDQVNIKNITYHADTDSYTFFYGTANPFFNIPQQAPIELGYLQNSVANIYINANIKWSVAVEPPEATEWLNIPKLTGINEFDFQINTLSHNIGDVIKTATLTFTGNGISIPISVSQRAIIPQFSSGDNVSFDYTESASEINIITNLDWDITDINGDWFTFSAVSGSGNKTLVVTAQENTGFEARNGSFKVNAYLDEQVVTVTQAPTPIMFAIDSDNVELIDSGEMKDIIISSNIPWTVTNWPQWIALSAINGTGGTLTIEATDNYSSNQRSGIVTIENTEWNKTASFTVTQLGKDVTLSVSQSAVIVGAAETERNVGLTANYEWFITNTAGWITVTPASGTSSAVLNIKVSENLSTTQRTATLTINSIDKNTVINVIQSGAVINFSISTQEITLFAENEYIETVDVISTHLWSGYKTGNWFTFSPTGGTGNETVTITALSENYGDDIRTGTITFMNNLSQPVVLTIHQENIVNISRTSFSELALYPNPATSSFRVSANFDKLSLFNGAGQLVKTSFNDNSEIDVSTLPAGIYFVVIESNNNRITKKLVITK